ncbi:MAG: PAS domain S-box protein [Candidatus Zixiibacteriota bacterium]
MDTHESTLRRGWIVACCVLLIIAGTLLSALSVPGNIWEIAYAAAVILAVVAPSRRLAWYVALLASISGVLTFVLIPRATYTSWYLTEELVERVVMLCVIWAVAILGTQRRQTESRLRDSEAYRRGTVDAAAVGIVTIEEDGNVRTFNPAAERIFGYNTAEVIGRHARMFVPDGDHGRLEADLKDLLGNANSPLFGKTREVTCRRKDGSEFPLELTLSVVPLKSKRLITAVVRDITESKRNEATLRESQRALSALMGNLPGMAYRCRNDEHWTMQLVSAGCFELTGYKPWDLVGNRKIAYAKLIHPEDRAGIWEQVQAALQKHVRFQFTYRIITAQGTEKWVWEQGQGIFSPEGELLGLEGFIMDTTDRVRAEQAVRESEERFRSIADAVPAMIWVCGTDKMCSYVSKSWTDFTGRAFEQEVGIGWTESLHPDDHEQALKTYADAFDHWRPFEMEYRVRRADGEYRLIRDSGVPRFGPDGQFIGYIGMCTDVTERQQARRALEERESILRAILESTADGILVVDSVGKVTHANERFARMWRIPRALMEAGDDAKLLEFVLDQLVSPEAFLAKVQRLYKSREEDTDTLAFKDGREFERFSCPLIHEGNLAGRVWSFRDITGRHRVEEELRKLSRAVEQSPVSVVITDLEGSIEYVNPKFEALTGYTADEARGRNPRILKSGETPADTYRQMWETIKSGQVWRGEFHNKKKNGELYWESASISPITDPSGQITHYVAVKEDITAQKQAEQALHLTQFGVDCASDAIFWIQPDGRFCNVNQAACHKLGYTREELLSMSVWDIDSDLPREDWLKCWDGVRRSGSRAIETRHRAKNGHEFPVEILANYLEFGGREYDCAFARDITERKRVEQVLQDIARGVSAQSGAAFFDSLVDHLARVVAADYAFIGELEAGPVERIRTVAVHAKGGKGDNFAYELAGTPCERIVNQRERAFSTGIQQLFPQDHLLIELGVDAYAAIPLFASDGRPLGLMGVLYRHPLANPEPVQAMLRIFAARAGAELERQQAEIRLSESESRYRRLFEESPLCLVEENLSAVKVFIDDLRARGVTDMRAHFERHPDALTTCISGMRITAANQAALRAFDVKDAQEIIARRSSYHTQQSLEVMREFFLSTVEGSMTQESDFHVVGVDGVEKVLHCRSRVAPGSEDSWDQVLFTLVDISEQLRTQEELAHARRLETAGRIAGQIAHDLNNILGPLVAYPDLIRDALPSDHQMQTLIDDMESAALQIAEINQDLLTLGRRGQYKIGSLDLNALVKKAVDHLDIPAGVMLETHFTGTISPIRGGETEIVRVLSNLLTNALEAMNGHGRLTIRTGHARLEKPPRLYRTVVAGDYVKLEIADTGRGIPSEIRDRVFEPFFSTKTGHEKRGSGLGLSVVHAILEDHDAYIDLDSIENVGTSVRVYFPVADPAITNGVSTDTESAPEEHTAVAGGLPR